MIKKRTLLYTLFFSVIFLFFCAGANRGAEDILFCVNILILFFVLIQTQFSMISLWMIISNYMLINVYNVYKTGSGYGLLASTKNIYMREMDILLLIFNISILVWVSSTPILKNEKTMLKCDLNISKSMSELMAVGSVIMAYIAYPELRFGITSNRFNALLPGHFWNHLMIILLIFASYRLKSSNIVKGCIAVITVWVLLHGERVDIMGFYVYLLIRYCVRRGYRINYRFISHFGIVILAAFCLLIYIGESRVGKGGTFNFSRLLSSVFSQGTASDVGYVFNSAIDFTGKGALLNGRTYITYIQGMVPILDQPERAGAIIQNLYKTAGGEYILVEPLINFGYAGVILFTNLCLMLVNFFLKKKNAYRAIVLSFLISTAFRYIWYGLTYIETGLLYLIPVVWLAIWFFEKKVKIMYQENRTEKGYKYS